MRPRVFVQRGLRCCAMLAICVLASSPRGLVVFVLLAVCAFYTQRVLWRWQQGSGRSRFGFFPTHAAAGNAFQQLQMFAEPQTAYVMQEKAKDAVEDDDSGELEDEANLMLQLRKIRDGDRSTGLVVAQPYPDKDKSEGHPHRADKHGTANQRPKRGDCYEDSES